MLEFLKAVYSSSKLVVKCGQQKAVTKVLRGVRQGCPMSPILFDLFINDVLDTPGFPRGVSIPGVNERVKGLLFADDMVCLGTDKDELCAVAGALTQWGAKNEMGFGIDKCGVMVVGASADHNMESEKGVFFDHWYFLPL